MADDIVTRLQEMLDGPVPMSVSRQDIRDALTEIEGLRAEVNMMASAQAGWGQVARLNDEIKRLHSLVKSVQQAIDIEGPSPAYHWSIVERHRNEWPTLWRAIDALLDIDHE